jgi:hypothetical protein
MSDYQLPHACKPVYMTDGKWPYYSVHVEDHAFHLYTSDVTPERVETFAASLAARIRLAEFLEDQK